MDRLRGSVGGMRGRSAPLYARTCKARSASSNSRFGERVGSRPYTRDVWKASKVDRRSSTNLRMSSNELKGTFLVGGKVAVSRTFVESLMWCILLLIKKSYTAKYLTCQSCHTCSFEYELHVKNGQIFNKCIKEAACVQLQRQPFRTKESKIGDQIGISSD